MNFVSGSVMGKIETVDVNPCPSEPCQLKRNTNVTITLDFTPSKYLQVDTYSTTLPSMRSDSVE